MKLRPGVHAVSLAVQLILLCGFLIVGSPASHAQGLVSWWPGNGNYVDVISGNNGVPIGGVQFLPAVYGEGFYFDGVAARVFVHDVPKLAITGSMTICAWVWVACYPPSPNLAGQILFRGDDRSGLDPYSLCVNPQGDLRFQVVDANNDTTTLAAPIPLGTYVFVAATLDDASGLMSLYENGKLVDQVVTAVRPYANLDPNSNPGIGIGSIQSANYDEYFEGIIDDLKIYNTNVPRLWPAKLSLSGSTVKGGTTVSASVTLNDSPIIPTSVSVTGSIAAASVPAKVTVSAGHYFVNFSIKTTAVTKSESGKISVKLNGTTVSTNLTVTP